MEKSFKQDLKGKNDFPGAPFIVRHAFQGKARAPEAGK